MLDQAQRSALLKIARRTMRHYLETGKRLDVETEDETLKQDMGAFVTLHKGGQLRGCIGNMTAAAPIYLTVRDMAIAAATEDPRFTPVTIDEMDEVDIEISALSPMKKIDDYNQIEIGRHGVMVRRGLRAGVYLPQVAHETGWDREQFMNSLCAHKAGIPMDAWKRGECEIYIFTAEVFGEKSKGDE
ncbi:MAG: AmmeMemoRadiSam system protein A [Candidatus Omnitrophota bacterium]